MYLLYIDHSGEIMNPAERYFIMGAVAVFERQIYFVERALDDLQRQFLPDTPDQVEFHASVMHGHRESPWKGLGRNTINELMIAIYDQIARTHVGFCLFGEAIEKNHVVPDFAEKMRRALEYKKEAKPDPETERRGKNIDKEKLALAEKEIESLTSAIINRAFERLCTQFEFYVRRFYDEDPEHQQRGIMIFDHASYERDIRLLMKPFRTLGTGAIQVLNIVETPLFASSSDSRMLQIADFVSYALYRRYEMCDTRFFDIIARRFDCVDGVFHGLAHLTTNAACACPACLTRRLR